MVENEVLRVFDEVKKMRVRPSELLFTIHSKGVVPDDPTSTMKTNRLSFDFQFSRVLIADRQPKRPIVLENTMDLRHPIT